MHRRLLSLLLLLALLLLPGAVSGQQAAPAEKQLPIQDNSFLVEEAYNQEKGVVQHINTFMRATRGGSWDYSFTQEWPITSQRHQLSYTLHVLRNDDAVPGASGLGDALVNYRYQLIGSGETMVAFSPRLSALVPSGSSRRGLGAGGAGLQANLPLSIALPGGAFVSHSNAGLTYTPRARDASGNRAGAVDYYLGQSVIWLAGAKLNFMLEGAWLSREDVVGPARTVRSTEFLLSPGVRAAFDFSSGLQVVPGVAFPIGVGASKGEHFIFAYLSLEHPFGKRTPALKRGT